MINIMKECQYIISAAFIVILLNNYLVESSFQVTPGQATTRYAGLSNKIRVKRAWSYPAAKVRETSGGTFERKITSTIKSDNPRVVKYVLVQSDAVNEGIFSMENIPGAGEIWQEKAVDREKVSQYILTGLALDSFGIQVEEPVKLTIIIEDENDNKPIFKEDTLLGSIPEDAKPGDRVMQLSATDADSKEVNNNGVVRFRYGGNEEPYSSQPRFNVAQDGTVTVVGNLDAETVPTIKFLVIAKDGPENGLGFTVTATATVSILDVNDHAPEYTHVPYNTMVGEHLPLNSTVFTVTATDIDQGVNKEVTFKIVAGNTNGKFSIQSHPSSALNTESTGDIVLEKQFDFEKEKREYVLRITAYNRGAANANLYEKTETVIIRVSDENDPPVFVGEPYTGRIQENLLDPVSNIATVKAIDMDFGGRQIVSYSIENLEGWFTVSADGKITAIKPVDREHPAVNNVTSQYVLHVRATDNDAIPQFSTTSVNITVGDVNDNVPEKGSGWNATVCEIPNPAYKNLTTIVVLDQDSPVNGPPFTANIIDSDQFYLESIDSESFIVQTNILQFDIGEKRLYEIPIELKDTHAVGEVRMTSTQTLSVTICNCDSDYVLQCPSLIPIIEAGASVAVVVAIIAVLCILLFIVLAVVANRRRNKIELEKQALFMDDNDDDIRENLNAYRDEGGGEEDNDSFDFNALQVVPVSGSKLYVEPLEDELLSSRSALLPESDIGDYIFDVKRQADRDPLAPPFDSLLVFDYEGQGSDASSLSSLNSGTTDASQDYDYLNDWGPKFKKLADLYGGENKSVYV